MFAKSNARKVFRHIISSFAVICEVCQRRVTTCRHNRMTKYSYWMMTHKYTPRDCDREFAMRKAQKVSGSDIARAFTAP